jgi:hypothetical protein
MSNTIRVPFCYLPNSKAQVFDLDTSYRSKFQAETLLKISQRDDFAYFVTLQHEGKSWLFYDQEPQCSGPCHISWYSKDGAIHSAYVGRKRIIRAYDSKPEYAPVPLDHTVYTSRCN